jgi:translation elongation factor EF-1beta
MNQLFKQGIEQLAKGRNDILFGLKNLHFENIMTNEGQDIWKQMERFIQKTEDAFRRLEEEYGELK